MKNVLFNKPVYLMLAFSITFLSFSYAQPDRGPLKRLSRLAEVLELSDAQQSELEVIQANYKEKFAVLKDSDIEDKKTAFHDLMKNLKSDVDAILTDAQKAELQTIKAESGTRRQKPENLVALKKALTDYRNTTILPVMQTQRLKLEASITAEDKSQIDEIRSQLADLHASTKGGPRKGQRREKPNFTEDQKAALNALKALVEKYQADIQAVMGEIEPNFEQWKLEMKAIQAAHLDRQPQSGDRHHKSHMHRPFRKAGQFLLLEVPEPSPNLKANFNSVVTNVSVFPNPAQHFSNVSFQVLEPGNVSLIMMNEQGQEEEVLFSKNLDAGNQQLELDLSNLKNGLHYIMIIQESGQVTTEKLIISRP